MNSAKLRNLHMPQAHIMYCEVVITQAKNLYARVKLHYLHHSLKDFKFKKV